MPTSEERREVADRLRSNNGSSGLFDNTFLELFHDVTGRYPDMNLSRGKCETELLFKRLADLIEPEPERTCKIVNSENKFVNWECSACGEEIKYSDNYCPNCGAKVVK